MEQLPLSVPGSYFLSDQGSPTTWEVASACVQAERAAHGLSRVVAFRPGRAPLPDLAHLCLFLPL